MELGMISSTWLGTKIGLEQGIREARRIGFDTYDIFEDPLDIDDATRKLIKDTSEEVGLPIRSVVCVAFGLVDFNPSVQRFHVDRCKKYLDMVKEFGSDNLLLVLGEYIWEQQVIRPEDQWKMGVENVRRLGDHARKLGVRIALELEPFKLSLLNTVERMAKFLKDVGSPAVMANCDISHLHLAKTPFEEVQKLKGKIAHVHLSDCDGKVHGDLPPGRGCTPIKEYLAAVAKTGFDGVVSIELEYSPAPDKIVEWVTEAYRETDKIMRALKVRDGVVKGK